MRLFPLLVFLLLLQAGTIQAREPGRGREIALIGTLPIVVYTYRPQTCDQPQLLFVFAGYHRDADKYRNKAIPVANRACLLVAAPLLDRERFPNWRYHRAGVTRGGRVQPREEWTGPLLAALIDWGRTWARKPNVPYVLFGHSAGGQFLSRIAAFAPPTDPHRIVIANPSVHVAPLLDAKAPYGFGGVFNERERRARLQAYLKLPLTIYLGTADNGSKRLVQSAAANRQGATR
ncbi:MAG: hypothetical protein ACR2O4_16750 [Hyphomicrobiaceae bacterium]